MNLFFLVPGSTGTVNFREPCSLSSKIFNFETRPGMDGDIERGPAKHASHMASDLVG